MNGDFMTSTPDGKPWTARLPFFYGWIVVAVAAITMAIGVNSRSAFSLLMPPILDEFGWTRGDTALIFAIGFAVSAPLTPFIAVAIGRFGPRLVFPIGALIVGSGLAGASFAREIWHFYVTLGFLVVGGTVIIAYVGHGAFLPNWFARRRGLAIGIAYSGVGVGSIVMLPWVQSVIDSDGWRTACIAMAVLVVVAIVPLNLLLQRTRPQDLGLHPDGDKDGVADPDGGTSGVEIVDFDWTGIDWTLKRALATARFWWLGCAFAGALFPFYGILVHQTKFLIEIGISSTEAAFALGLTALFGTAGQIAMGYFSDRVSREWGWSIGMVGYVVVLLILLQLNDTPARWLVYLMVAIQGLIAQGISPIYAAASADLFQGRGFSAIFGVLSLAAVIGGALGPWAFGAFYDIFGRYDEVFWLTIAISAVSIAALWLAAPRKVRRPARPNTSEPMKSPS